VNIFQKGTLLLEEADVVHLIKDRIGLDSFLNQILEALEIGFKEFAIKRASLCQDLIALENYIQAILVFIRMVSSDFVIKVGDNWVGLIMQTTYLERTERVSRKVADLNKLFMKL
jgi:hypothetical protein